LRRHARRLAWILGTLGFVMLSACSDMTIGPPIDNCQIRCGH